jgi:8-oxo-dGTP diphosphatase
VTTERRAWALVAAIADAAEAIEEFDDARAWMARALREPMPPLAAEVWVFDDARRRVLLVRHRWRGWVPPGGRVEPEESPRQGAARECLEETGVKVDLAGPPVAVSVRSFKRGWAPTLSLSYAAVVPAEVPLVPEPGAPVAWMPLDHPWDSVFPDDHARIAGYAARVGAEVRAR